jgi:hypothetical protein
MHVLLKDVATTLISGLSLALSAYALWQVQFNHGRLKMTQPTLLCLKREQPSMRPKIFLRTLLFATGPKGRVIENMFLKVHQNNLVYNFDFWGHTEGGKLTLGSGLFVGPTGLACDHHFNLRDDSNTFLFLNGDYSVEVFATVVGRKQPDKLAALTFNVDGLQSAELIQIPKREMFLRWNAENRSYDGRVDHSIPSHAL